MLPHRYSFVSEILKKYTDQEEELDKKLHYCENMRHELCSRVTLGNYDSMTHLHLNREASLSRNRQMLKDLEISKARLRTFSAFSPTDQELNDIATFYRRLLATEKI
ncbi:uncharacterized protein LOC127291559 [Leptopilina boulardi]|uniref:uncharacterized protein LOC127291559 n=1 Tax=Leptopilina boulardi TaxID=63433 RepID=UPI0021F61062|nr:uncharacterized protein LOC127291559 [Leptopilina boulardi]